IALRRIGRFLQGLAVLVWALSALHVSWSIPKVALLVSALLGGGCLFIGIVIIQATMAFWTVETLEVMNSLTYGGEYAAEYPMAIYRPWFRRFFTLVIPLACANYFPAMAILGK